MARGAVTVGTLTTRSVYKIQPLPRTPPPPRPGGRAAGELRSEGPFPDLLGSYMRVPTVPGVATTLHDTIARICKAALATTGSQGIRCLANPSELSWPFPAGRGGNLSAESESSLFVVTARVLEGWAGTGDSKLSSSSSSVSGVEEIDGHGELDELDESSPHRGDATTH